MASRRTFVNGALCVTAAMAYVAATDYVLSASTARVYGFPVSRDLRTLIEIALQVCPMLAGFLLVLLLPVKEQLVDALSGRFHRTLAIVAASAVAAMGAVIATAVAVSLVGGQGGKISPTTLLWVAGEFAFDVTLIGIFTTLLYSLKRRVWLTMPLFLAYVAIVLLAGNRWGITSYIGFASSVPVMLTTYSTAPLFDRAAWVLRGYWASVSILIIAVLHAFDRPPRSLAASILARFRGPGRPWRALLAITPLCVVVILAAGGLVELQRQARVRRRAPSASALRAATRGENAADRLHLTQYTVALHYSPAKETVDVEGVLTFRNGGESIHSAYFQIPGLLAVEGLSISGGGPARISRLGRYAQARFDRPVPPSQEIWLSYRGSISPAGPFDLSAQGKVLENAFFLTDSDILPAARRPACLESAQPDASLAISPDCGATENYLMCDLATGTITVVAPNHLRVVSPGVESVRQLPGGITEHVFTVVKQQLATFLVASAPFHESVAVTAFHGAVHVFRAGASGGDMEAPVAADILGFYDSVWPPYGKSELKIVEIPTPLGEAMAFDGAVAISDKIISSRSPLSGNASDFLSFVMAHEIAHQWWGFRVLPARSPGRLFVLESIAQFAAYRYLFARRVLDLEAASRHEERRYQSARARLGSREVPLAQSSVADEVAYNKGPFALLTLDGMGGGSLMRRLGGLIEQYSAESAGIARPEQVMTGLIAELPPSAHKLASEFLYEVGLPPEIARR